MSGNPASLVHKNTSDVGVKRWIPVPEGMVRHLEAKKRMLQM